MKHSVTTCTIILIINLLVSLFSLSMAMPQEIKTIEVSTPKEKVLRLHILADSDAFYDQAIKYQVRKQITSKIARKFNNTQDVETAKESINASQKELTHFTDKLLQQEGASYKSQLNLIKKEFPTRLYGNQLYTAGEYEALQISLGQAQGENWWCVIFPVFCHVEEVGVNKNKEVDAVKNDANSEIKKGNNAKNGEEYQHEEKGLEVRFYFLELLDKLL